MNIPLTDAEARRRRDAEQRETQRKATVSMSYVWFTLDDARLALRVVERNT